MDGASSKVRWWEKVEEPTTVWQALFTDDGVEYFVNTETKETTWDKPEELMTTAELNARGDWVWTTHEKNVYVPAKLISSMGKKSLVETEDGTQRTVKKVDCLPCMRSWLKRIVPDLTLLDDMGAPLILHNLRKRFEEKSEIYTNVGNILISINPYKMLDFYTPEQVRRYSQRKMGQELPPHVFNIAHDSYYGLTSFKALQSIIISGESGAGKTEATKQCLQYLAAVAGSRSGVENKILKANPVLEAFGNAKTIRNDNSSRFGKYMEVYFDGAGKICGSATENYLLEKIRVVQPAKDERNFHIFYQLTKAAPADVKSKLKLSGKKPSDFVYTRACTDVSTINDARDFEEVQNAFKELGFDTSDKEVMGMYAIVAAILHIGNICFEEGKPDESKISSSSLGELEDAASVLRVGQKVLEESLITRTLRIRGQGETKCMQTPEQSAFARDALCKFVYGRMFDWLVERVNKSMGGQKQALYIGILDIFGFEIFKHNSFEQLCINFTNEMLQQHFNNNTFKLEESIYNSEGIEWDHIEFIDNQPMIELITKRHDGILPILDEELKIPQGSDKGFLRKLVDKQTKNPIFKRVMKNPMHFIVKHYAGIVEYDGNDFLEKNRDTLSGDMIEMLQKSSHPFINALYPPSEQVSSTDRKASLGKQFRSQLDSLMVQLNRTSPHYIRCVKPNDDKAPLKFVPRNCYEQLTYSGVFEAVAIRKQGFPFRLTHQGFVERYAKITDGAVSAGGGDVRSKCKDIIRHMKLDTGNIKVGKSRILYRALEYRQLELRWSIVNKNETITKNLARLVNVPSFANDAEKERYIIELADAVREADIFRVNTPDAQKGRALLEKFVEERMDPETKRRLRDAKDTMDRAKLESVLEHCEREGYITKLVRECREILDNIIDAEAAIAVATSQLREDYLVKALKMCAEFFYEAPIVQQTKKLLKALRKANEGFGKVWSRAPKYNYKVLGKILSYCDTNKLHALSSFSRGKKLYLKLKKARKMMTAAYDGVDEEALEKALEHVQQKRFDGTDYQCQLQKDCKELLARIKKINKETKKATKECVEDQVRTIVAAADQIRLRTKALSKLRKLVKGPYNAFLKEQLRCAKKCGHNDRAVRVSVKIRDGVVRKDRKGDRKLQVFANFRGLKDSVQWASSKWFANKEKLASGMLRWQKATLHSPLTRNVESGFDKGHVKLMKRLSKNNFETVQKYMAQRNSTHMPLRLEELLTSCVAHVEIRDEFYLGAMKQTQDNPEAGSAIPRLFELLALALTAFPPSEDLRDFLEAFVRKSEYASYSKSHNCSFLLSRICYLGAVSPSSVPAKEAYNHAMMHEGRLCREHAALDVLKRRLNLDGAEEPVYSRSNCSWAKLKQRRTSLDGNVLKDVKRDWK